MTKTNLEMLEELSAHLEQKEIELVKTEKRLRTILDLTPLGMFLVTNRTIRWVNRRLCEITGYEPADLKYQSTRILYESEAEFIRVGKAVYSGLNEAKTKTSICRKDGTCIPCTLHVVIIDQCDNDAVVATYIDFERGC